jgi:hypothetical protein
MDTATIESSIFNSTNITCSRPLLWTQATIDDQKARLYVCIIATFTHSIFWLQLVFCSSVRQKSMQWIYAYLITDILLIFRFFFTYIVHTTSTECEPSQAWTLFFCYFGATADNYLNILEVYILLALNVCRYAQIAYNRNVYQVHKKLLILAHVGIYLGSLISLLIQFLSGWCQLDVSLGHTCKVTYTNIYIKIFNIITAFALPIGLNIIMIYASVRHVRLTSTLQRAQHHVSAREKYNRSLVIQFLVFYIIWVSLWSPNVIVYQVSIGGNVTAIVRLLNFIEIALDPIIIAALDVRFWQAWQTSWVYLKHRLLLYNLPIRGRIQPTPPNLNVVSLEPPPLRTTAF